MWGLRLLAAASCVAAADVLPGRELSSSSSTPTSQYAEGPRVGNEVWQLGCGAASDFDTAASVCDADGSCTVLHAYDCMDYFWRACTITLEQLQAASPAGDTSACTRLYSGPRTATATTTSTSITHTLTEVYLDGPRVPNDAWAGACSVQVYELDEAKVACTADPSCKFLHAYSCNDFFWRTCTGSISDVFSLATGSDEGACTKYQSSYATSTLTTTTSIYFVDGFRVGNSAWEGLCSYEVYTLQEAQQLCYADPGCTVLHSYGCQEYFWRYCSGPATIEDIQSASTDHMGCTKVLNSYWFAITTTTSVTTTTTVMFVEGPHVGNNVWTNRCYGNPGSLEFIEESCLTDNDCSIVHCYKCQTSWGCRACSGTIVDMVNADPNTGSCTRIAHYLLTDTETSTTTSTATETGTTISTSLTTLSDTTGSVTSTTSATMSSTTTASTTSASTTTSTLTTVSSTTATSGTTTTTSATSGTETSSSTRSTSTETTASETSTTSRSTVTESSTSTISTFSNTSNSATSPTASSTASETTTTRTGTSTTGTSWTLSSSISGTTISETATSVSATSSTSMSTVSFVSITESSSSSMSTGTLTSTASLTSSTTLSTRSTTMSTSISDTPITKTESSGTQTTFTSRTSTDTISSSTTITNTITSTTSRTTTIHTITQTSSATQTITTTEGTLTKTSGTTQSATDTETSRTSTTSSTAISSTATATSHTDTSTSATSVSLTATSSSHTSSTTAHSTTATTRTTSTATSTSDTTVTATATETITSTTSLTTSASSTTTDTATSYTSRTESSNTFTSVTFTSTTTVSSVVVKGSLSLEVANAEDFVSDPLVQQAMASSVASMASVAASLVEVTMSLGRLRRLSADSSTTAAVEMEIQQVNVDYTILTEGPQGRLAVVNLQRFNASTVADVLQEQLEVQLGPGASQFAVQVLSFSVVDPLEQPSVTESPGDDEKRSISDLAKIAAIGAAGGLVLSCLAIFLGLMCVRCRARRAVLDAHAKADKQGPSAEPELRDVEGSAVTSSDRTLQQGSFTYDPSDPLQDPEVDHDEPSVRSRASSSQGSHEQPPRQKIRVDQTPMSMTTDMELESEAYDHFEGAMVPSTLFHQEGHSFGSHSPVAPEPYPVARSHGPLSPGTRPMPPGSRPGGAASRHRGPGSAAGDGALAKAWDYVGREREARRPHRPDNAPVQDQWAGRPRPGAPGASIPPKVEASACRASPRAEFAAAAGWRKAAADDEDGRLAAEFYSEPGAGGVCREVPASPTHSTSWGRSSGLKLVSNRRFEPLGPNSVDHVANDVELDIPDEYSEDEEDEESSEDTAEDRQRHNQPQVAALSPRRIEPSPREGSRVSAASRSSAQHTDRSSVRLTPRSAASERRSHRDRRSPRTVQLSPRDSEFTVGSSVPDEYNEACSDESSGGAQAQVDELHWTRVARQAEEASSRVEPPLRLAGLVTNVSPAYFAPPGQGRYGMGHGMV